MPQKQKLNLEEKVRLIKSYQKGEQGLRKSAELAGVAYETFRRWVKRYEVEGVDAFKVHSQQVYSPDLKWDAVQAYLSGEGSQIEVSKKYKLRDARILEHWIKVYNAHGDFNSVKFSGGGSYMKQGRETTLEERIQIAKECIACGKNYGEMALKHQVSYQQVRSWTLRYEEMGEAGLQDRRGRRKKDQTPRTELEQAQIEIEQLKHKLYLAEMERDLLKKLDQVERRYVSRK